MAAVLTEIYLRGVCSCHERFVAAFVAAVLTEIYLCNVCSCHERLRRRGRGQDCWGAWAAGNINPPGPRPLLDGRSARREGIFCAGRARGTERTPAEAESEGQAQPQPQPQPACLQDDDGEEEDVEEEEEEEEEEQRGRECLQGSSLPRRGRRPAMSPGSARLLRGEVVRRPLRVLVGGRVD
eukprot:COSAG01_NODE_10233_length_2214_cov_3.079905_3_plen_182_part_00